MTRILVVEDERELAMGLEDDLKLEGYDVEVQSDGESASRRAREKPFDLIILDVMLPRKDGFEVCRELAPRGLEHTHHSAHCESAGIGQGARPRNRRRRLCHEAIQPARAASARKNDSSPGIH